MTSAEHIASAHEQAPEVFPDGGGPNSQQQTAEGMTGTSLHTDEGNGQSSQQQTNEAVQSGGENPQHQTSESTQSAIGQSSQSVVRSYTISSEDDDEDAAMMETAPSSTSNIQSNADLAFQIREKFRFLKPEDQKTVCRRECHNARKREDDVLQQLQKCIDRYMYAIEVSTAFDSRTLPHAAPPPLQEEANRKALADGPALPAEMKALYEERVKLLRGAQESLKAELNVPLPGPDMTPVEQAKGLAFSTYASAAEWSSKLVGSPAVDGARTAFTNFRSRFNRSASNVGAGGYGADFPQPAPAANSQPAPAGAASSSGYMRSEGVPHVDISTPSASQSSGGVQAQQAFYSGAGVLGDGDYPEAATVTRS